MTFLRGDGQSCQPRGALCYRSLHMAFEAMELAFQVYLCRLLGSTTRMLLLSTSLSDDGDVQFYCCVMSTITEECAQRLLKLLVETIHGFALACIYRRVQNEQGENYQRKKGLRKELKCSETTTKTIKEDDYDE